MVTALDLGAWGGKLCGAGGGGFLLFLAPPARHQAIIGRWVCAMCRSPSA
jgi:galactokinase/mevalonate kinase-like predicted kinase